MTGISGQAREEAIRERLYTMREYFRAKFVTLDVAAPASSELIWVLTGDESMGEDYMQGRYEIPSASLNSEPATDNPAGGAR